MTLSYDEISRFADMDRVLNYCLMAIICPKGRFYPNKSYGNSLLACSEPGGVLAAARQAVCGIDGVFIKRAEAKGDAVDFEIMINDEVRRLSVNIGKNL